MKKVFLVLNRWSSIDPLNGVKVCVFPFALYRATYGGIEALNRNVSPKYCRLVDLAQVVVECLRLLVLKERDLIELIIKS